jgi:uncharacterized protein (DUF2267 family)
MATDFDRYAAKGNEFVNLLADDLQVPRDKAMRILRAVLHATRNHIPVQESLQLLAQLPMALRGVYVDQWSLRKHTPRIHHLKQFLDEVRSCDKGLANYDFGNDESAARAVKAVYRALNYHVTDGEFEDLAASLPMKLRKFVLESIGENKMPL